MADKCGQFYNGTDWQQFGLTTADITLGAVVANSFYTIKDASDTMYVLCGYTTTSASRNAKIIRLTKDGAKSVITMSSGNNTGNWVNNNITHEMCISKDQQYLFLTTSQTNAANVALWQIPISSLLVDGELIDCAVIETASVVPKFAIYKDRYIWVASGSTVKIYDYTTKAELASIGITLPGQGVSITSICCGVDNTLYCAVNSYTPAGVIKLNYSGGTPTPIVIVNNTSGDLLFYQKQLLIDKWGDLIILTNSGTASTLLKYTTAGVQIGTTLNLATASYNLNTDTKGNYYYQTALATYKIAKNDAQGVAFNPIPTEPMRATGNTGFGSNFTGYQPSVYN